MTEKKEVSPEAQDHLTSASNERAAQPVGYEHPPKLPYPVVGMGASAGGLEACSAFLRALPNESGMAFVLVQHLPPERESLIAEILSKKCAMPVIQIESGMAVRPDHVYVIRPGHTLVIADGKLLLTDPLEKPGHRRPVDDFFRSLAIEQQQRAICIVFSGMGTNGSAGAQAVKAVGGVCIAQDPDSAQYPSMPLALIDNGIADYVLRPEDMPEILLRYANHPYVTAEADAEKAVMPDGKLINEILGILRTRTRQEFSGYKKPTVLRRVQRRMGLNHVTDLMEYVRLLRQNTTEAASLADDLMIHVTGFFRDPEAWDALRKKVFEPLVAERESEAPIRAWVTACSTGEEAYTLAMLLMEVVEKADKHFDIKIFATDTADRSLGHARGGVYPGGIESEIPPDRLSRFFDKDDSSYRVKKELREMVIFAPQNVLQDPPFSRLDLCSCRNLLIYLEPEIQHRVLTLLHFGLRDSGTLFLGSAETIGDLDGLFEPIDKKHRIFRRIGPTRHGTIPFPAGFRLTGVPAKKALAFQPPRPSVLSLVQNVLLERFSPPSVVVDRQHRVVLFYGKTDPFLTQPAGEPTREIMQLLREQLHGPVRSALHHAISRNDSASARSRIIEHDGKRFHLGVTVLPLENVETPDHFLISFEQTEDIPEEQPPLARESQSETELVNEVQRLRDELQSTVEEFQAGNEELQASNEEITSINEELQSTNEELETSKEELQSLNEELSTVNSQLRAKMEELENARNDLSSLLSSTDIAVLFLDRKSRIRRYTPAVKDLFELIPGDVGRPIADLAQKFDDPNLVTDVQIVLEKLTPVAREILSSSNRWYMRRTLPYRTADNRIDGIVLTFVDISHRKHFESDLSNARDGAETARYSAEAANTAKDQFLATVSHELRNPLNAVLMWNDLLLRKTIPASQIPEALEAIRRNAEAQRRLIDDLLDSTRISSGKLRLVKRPCDFRVIVRGSVEALRPAIEAKEIVFTSESTDDSFEMEADPDRLQQVVSNLLTNALKFTPAKGTIRVTLARRDQTAMLTVADSGQGIRPEFLATIFEPFRQGASRWQGGLGLGLTIARQLVELHGGTITVHSEGEGHGATFTVQLPVHAAPVIVKKKSAALDPSAMNEPLKGMSILLVEDDTDNREATARLLSSFGAAVDTAVSSPSALEALTKQRPDLVLCDIMMPGEDGVMFLKQLRDLEKKKKSPPVPVIALTALAGAADRDALLIEGFEAHVSKPVEWNDLIATLKKLKDVKEKKDRS